MKDEKLAFVLVLALICLFGATGCVDAVREGAVAGAGNAIEAAVETALSLLVFPINLVAASLGTITGAGN